MNTIDWIIFTTMLILIIFIAVKLIIKRRKTGQSGCSHCSGCPSQKTCGKNSKRRD